MNSTHQSILLIPANIKQPGCALIGLGQSGENACRL
jgi:hypothetical protein